MYLGRLLDFFLDAEHLIRLYPATNMRQRITGRGPNDPERIPHSLAIDTMNKCPSDGRRKHVPYFVADGVNFDFQLLQVLEAQLSALNLQEGAANA
jgi:hypothetical protein